MATTHTIFFSFLLFAAGRADMNSETSKLLCNAVRLRAPYIKNQEGRVGGVYVQRNTTEANRPTFARTISKEESKYDLLHYNKTNTRWVVRLSDGGHDSFYIISNASHPVLAKGVWQVMLNLSSGYTPFPKVTFECAEDPNEARANCTTIRLQTPFIPSQSEIVGKVFRQTNLTVNSRSVYESSNGGPKYVYYSHSLIWKVGGTYIDDDPAVNMFANSAVDHPANVRALWFYVKADAFRSADIFFECVKDPPVKKANCSTIRLRAPYIADQSAVVGAVFQQTGFSMEGHPVFSFNMTGKQQEMYVYYTKLRAAQWKVGENFTDNDSYFSMFTNSAASHPADIQATWFYAGSASETRFIRNSSIYFECVSEINFREANCSSIRLKGPFFPDQTSIFGAVFHQTNFTVNGHPVYQFYSIGFNEVTYVHYTSKTTSWNVNEQNLSNKTRIFANSPAKHPVDVQAMWYYASKDHSFLSSSLSFECVQDHSTPMPSTCKKVKLIAAKSHSSFDIYINMTLERMEYPDLAVGKRPIFGYKIPATASYEYLYFLNTSWSFGPLPFSKLVFAYARSNAMHPADVRSYWIYSEYESNAGERHRFHVLKNGSFICTDELVDEVSSCTTIKIIRPEGNHRKFPILNLELERLIGKPFRQTTVTEGNYPLFELKAAGSRYIIMHESITWGLYKGNSSFRYAFNYGTNLHPAELATPWYYQKKLPLERVSNFAVVCTGDDASSPEKVHISAPTIGISAAASAAVIGVLLVGAFIIVSKTKHKWLRKIRNRMRPTLQDLGNLTYDVFICYKCGGPGQDFTRNILYPKVTTEWGLSVALDVKDFVPGTPIDENIVRIIQDSKRVILVLTEDFLQSGWCKLETSCAHYLMANGGTKIVPVLLEDVTDSANLAINLRHILQTVTYLLVPENREGAAMERFWKLLQQALPTPWPDVSSDDGDGTSHVTEECDSDTHLLNADMVETMRLQMLDS